MLQTRLLSLVVVIEASHEMATLACIRVLLDVEILRLLVTKGNLPRLPASLSAHGHVRCTVVFGVEAGALLRLFQDGLQGHYAEALP